MPLQATSGAASYDAFGGGAAAAPPTYIEDVFSTYLINLLAGTGNQQIPHGLDLSTYGGLTWVKNRASAYGNTLGTTNIGTSKMLFTNTTDAVTSAASFVSFDTNGTTITRAGGYFGNGSDAVVSWNFRKQPKFFDIVTYTGNGTQGRSVSHNLGSAPGFMIVKRTDGVDNWRTYHRSLGGTKFMSLDTTAAAGTANTLWNDADPTSTVFYLGNDSSVNGNGMSYVAYLFAHNAGGFGLTGTDNVISCGSFTTDGSGNATVSLGYEPQWFLFKRSDSTSNWRILDVMRGGSLTQSSPLIPNLSSAESSFGSFWSPTATGFNIINQAASSTWIYIAIRRGPMKVPTTGTSVFAAVARTGTGSAANITTAGFTPDLLIGRSRLATTSTPVFVDRLRGNTKFLQSAVTDAEGTSSAGADVTDFLMNGFSLGVSGGTDLNTSSASEIYYPLKRAPSFFDEVCYTGTGSARTLSHNLQAVPELMIAKCRNDTGQWAIYSSSLSASEYLFLNSTAAKATNSAIWNSTSPTSSVFSVGTSANTNSSGFTFVAYLFATCAGVSKVGSYTGTATTKQIDCGFTGGARFVLIKRTDSTGDWYVWDTARGIVSGNDRYLLLNSTAAEVTNTDYIDTYSAGFEISSTAPAAINASGGSFIFFAVA